MHKQILLVNIFPSAALLCAGYLVGSQFGTPWLRLAVGIPAGIAAYFLYKRWGELICKKEKS